MKGKWFDIVLLRSISVRQVVDRCDDLLAVWGGRSHGMKNTLSCVREIHNQTFLSEVWPSGVFLDRRNSACNFAEVEVYYREKKIIGCSSGQGDADLRKILTGGDSPRAGTRFLLTWRNSMTDSKVWMREDNVPALCRASDPSSCSGK